MAPAIEAPAAVRPIRRALFVDRDGTLNPDLHYLKDSRRLELFRGVGRALARAHDHGYLLVVVTNQSGISRGLYTAEDVQRIHERLNELLRAERVQLDAFYYCPHTPEEGCRCRKPKTGLFEDAQRDLNIDFASSAIVGDRTIDIEAGRALGLLTGLVARSEHEAEIVSELSAKGTAPDLWAGSVEVAVSRVLARG